jgi:hypothetical protein
MGRVGALSAPLSDQAEFAASFQEGVEELQFGLALDQARAELAEHGVIEAGIGQFQGEGVLPVDAVCRESRGSSVGATPTRHLGRSGR